MPYHSIHHRHGYLAVRLKDLNASGFVESLSAAGVGGRAPEDSRRTGGYNSPGTDTGPSGGAVEADTARPGHIRRASRRLAGPPYVLPGTAPAVGAGR